jgi:negative regulator of flagellin synthesis FlgM
VKIDDTNKKLVSVGTTQARASKAPEPASAGASSDNVTLSAQASASQVSSGSVFDSQKVNEIKMAIANGQFKVNAESVADGLMNTVKDLISTRRG